jgi:riboflavin kinase, archaea type
MTYELLKIIAKEANMFSNINTSTIKLSKTINKSQQTVSRLLILMENKKLINRIIDNKGLIISLTDKGREIIKKEHEELSEILKPKNSFKGKIVNGLGEGAYYVNIYSKQIKDIINFKPFDGTLNLIVNISDFEKFVSDLKQYEIKEFKTNKRTYGRIFLYKAKIKNLDIALLKPIRTTHPEEIVEIIASFNIKEKYKLKEGDVIEINKR